MRESLRGKIYQISGGTIRFVVTTGSLSTCNSASLAEACANIGSGISGISKGPMSYTNFGTFDQSLLEYMNGSNYCFSGGVYKYSGGEFSYNGGSLAGNTNTAYGICDVSISK